jgi:hypothetical protein
MGSVVTRDVSPYSVVAGNPATKIKERFPERIAQGLLKSAWWTYGDEELKEAAVLFNDPEAFLEQKGLICWWRTCACRASTTTGAAIRRTSWYAST